MNVRVDIPIYENVIFNIEGETPMNVPLRIRPLGSGLGR